MAKNIQDFHTAANALLLITHLNQLIRFIRPDHVHILIGGRIVKEGGPELADEVEANGFDAYREA